MYMNNYYSSGYNDRLKNGLYGNQMNQNYLTSWPLQYASTYQPFYNNYDMSMQNAGFYPAVDGWRLNLGRSGNNSGNRNGRAGPAAMLQGLFGNNRRSNGRAPFNMVQRRENSGAGRAFGNVIPGMAPAVVGGLLGGQQPLAGRLAQAGLNNMLRRRGGGGGGGGANFVEALGNVAEISGNVGDISGNLGDINDFVGGIGDLL
ncbi:hypothetical protein I4U23_004914 [Adineta vaga]|nr:hypothetical protein I4U23_004914 [Adineta vaga]